MKNNENFLQKVVITNNLLSKSTRFFFFFLAVHDARKSNSNQLGILREILFNERDVKPID